MKAFRHKSCGNIGFYFRGEPRKGEMIYAADIIPLSGEPSPQPDEMLRCGACHDYIDLGEVVVQAFENQPGR